MARSLRVELRSDRCGTDASFGEAEPLATAEKRAAELALLARRLQHSGTAEDSRREIADDDTASDSDGLGQMLTDG